MSLIDQLLKVYYDEEKWHKTKLPEDEARKYFSELLRKGRIIHILHDDGSLIGYVESWAVNFEQFGRIVVGAPFSSYLEDVESGNIAYVANTWIREDYRRGVTYKLLRQRFLQQNFHCEYFCGEARRKKSAPLKVFTRQKLLEKIEREING